MTYPDHTPRWRRYLRLLRPNVRADVDDELRFHFESRIGELTALGMPVDAARAQAAAEFGDLREFRRGLVSIDLRVAAKRRRIEVFGDIVSDVTYSVRSLLRTPGVAFAILATLGLGVGANAAMFTLIDTIFLRAPAGVVDPGGIRRVWETVHSRDGVDFWPRYSYVQYSAIVDALGDRGAATIYRSPAKMRVGSGEGTGEVQGSFANASYFSVLGVRAEAGRLYTSDESRLDGPEHVVVLSHDYWMRAFGGNRSAIGSTITIASQAYTIVGVAASSFAGIDLSATDLWMPIGIQSGRSTATTPWWRNQNNNGFLIVVRPAAGVDDRELEQRLTTVLRRPEVRYLAADSATVVRFGSVVQANGPGDRSQEERIAIRLAAVAIIVLLIACANIVNLLLSRAIRRRREIAVRLALGISRARLMRLLLVESGVLAVAAAAVALIIAYLGGIVLRTLLLPDVHWARSPLDWSVVLVALGIAATAGLVAGLIPALQAATPELTSALKAGAGSGVVQRSRLRSGLVVVQAALSVVLLVGALLFVRSLKNVRNVDIGFDAQHIMTITVAYDGHSAWSDSTLPQRFSDFAERARTIPGVANAALASMNPMGGFSMLTYYTDADSSTGDAKWMPTVSAISPDYFAATGLRMMKGRTFSSSGSQHAAEVIVNEVMARALWPGRNPLGQCMYFAQRNAACYRVVGVVENSRMGKVIEEPMFKYYVPLDNAPKMGADLKAHYVIVRSSSRETGPITAAVRTMVRQQFPGAIPQITWLSDSLEPQYRPWRLGATLFTAFGVLALVVAVIGIYSTVSYGVNQRIHEFGVRIALGAGLSDVLRLVVGQGLRAVAAGIVLGVALALLAGRFIASLLYGVTPSDPLALTTVAAALLAVSAVAALIPAWRAARVNPVTALRSD